MPESLERIAFGPGLTIASGQLGLQCRETGREHAVGDGVDIFAGILRLFLEPRRPLDEGAATGGDRCHADMRHVLGHREGRLHEDIRQAVLEIIERDELLAELRESAVGRPCSRQRSRELVEQYINRAAMAKASGIGPGRPPLPEGDGKESHLHVRIEPIRKAVYVKAAQRSPHT